MNSHSQSWLPVEELGKRMPPYAPTYDFPPPFIDQAQRDIADCPLQDDTLIQMRNRRWFGKVIPGWLRREDALKLYELSYFAGDDVLELGSFHGLSTAILARAARNSLTPKHIETVDLDPACTEATRKNLKALGLLDQVTVRSADAVIAVREHVASRKRFGFIFIDHSHEYTPVFEVCQVLGQITVPGGFCLFHDFNDLRNLNPDDKDYGVYQAVRAGLDQEQFEFYGIYGCTALYRRVA